MTAPSAVLHDVPSSLSVAAGVLGVAFLLGFALAARPGHAAPGGKADDSAVCNDAELLSGKLITHICWDCMFPMVVAGAPLGGDPDEIPDAATDKAVCACKDNAGIYHPGIVKQHWEPARVVELVRQPGCSPSLGGARLEVGNEIAIGGGSEGGDNSGSGTSFYHYHYFAFPLLLMMDLVSNAGCNVDGYMDMDLLYMSELDPTWNNSMLSFFANPEAALVANPISISACAADAAAASAGEPIDSLFWCAGSWGGLYPLSGHDVSGGRPEDTSLLATRALAALHRRGLARRSMGDDAMCDAPIDVFLPKSQYKLSMFHPVPEGEEAHMIGESTYSWAAGKTVPGQGDTVYTLWRWKDCCMTY